MSIEYLQVMSENSREAEPTHLTEARVRFEKAQDNLFGLNQDKPDDWNEAAPLVDVSNPEAAKSAIREVVWSGLNYAKAEKDVAGNKAVTFKEAIRPGKVTPNHESIVTDFERAVDVIDGKRANPESLVKVISTLADIRQEEANRRHEGRITNLPDQRGITEKIFGMEKRVHPQDLAAESKYQQTEIGQIRDVRNLVIDNASNWAAPKGQ